MATWKKATGEPITTEREVRVFNVETGQEGWVSVRWGGVGHHCSFYGAVTSIVDRFFNPDGSEYQEPRRTVLDANPTFE